MTGSQAFRKHQLFDPLSEPGEADLTADVDFKYLTQCISDKGIQYFVLFLLAVHNISDTAL